MLLRWLKIVNRIRIRFLKDFQVLKSQVDWSLANKHNFTELDATVKPSASIVVGKHSYGTIKTLSFENPDEKLIIGDFVSIASDVLFIMGGNHQIDSFTSYPLNTQFLGKFSESDASTKGPIIIEDEVWIGANVIILSGVTVGRGAIIAAGSVVTKDVSPFTLVGGNPAKLIRNRYNEDIAQIRSAMSLTDFTHEHIEANIGLFYTVLDKDILYEIQRIK